MFDQIFKYPEVIARHEAAPYAAERVRYLAHRMQRGDSRRTLRLQAAELLWVAQRLSGSGGLHLTLEQVRAAADCSWKDRERACGKRLRTRRVRKDFVCVARHWLRYLGCLQEPQESIPFQSSLDAYCQWSRNERGLSEATIEHKRGIIKDFLHCYGTSAQGALADVRINDIDAFLTRGADTRGWSRLYVRSVASELRVFFRFSGARGWTPPALVAAIQGPRVYSQEGLPKGPSWKDVERLFASLDIEHPKDLRDRAMLMLLAVYGLRAGEVAKLRLEHLDWQGDLLRVPRSKRRCMQTYPLLPSVGHAIIEYLRKARPHSAHREIFLTLRSPYQPVTRWAQYWVVADRLKALGIQSRHYGPHCLRHACATRLTTDGLSLKQVGDHLGHVSPSSTRVYAKVDLPSLRQVAAFDLGELP